MEQKDQRCGCLDGFRLKIQIGAIGLMESSGIMSAHTDTDTHAVTAKILTLYRGRLGHKEKNCH